MFEAAKSLQNFKNVRFWTKVEQSAKTLLYSKVQDGVYDHGT